MCKERTELDKRQFLIFYLVDVHVMANEVDVYGTKTE